MFNGGLRRVWVGSGVHSGNIRRAAGGLRDSTPATGCRQENDDARTTGGAGVWSADGRSRTADLGFMNPSL